MLLLKHVSFDAVGGNMKLDQNISSSKVVISQTKSFNYVIIIVDSSVSTIAFITLDMTIILPRLRIICIFHFA